MNENYNRKTEAPDDGEYLYKSVLEGKKKSRIWSVVSLISSILSIICCCVPWPGAVLGILSIVFAVVSRSNIGYFDKIALAGLIVGIFGTVFSVFMIVITNTPWYQETYLQFMEEYMKSLEEMEGSNSSMSV